MRFVVYGAGAIGGVVGARLLQAGHDVVLIARGAHLDAIQRHGLRVDSSDVSATVQIRAVANAAEARVADGDVVLLTMKTQDTAGALQSLAACAPPDTPIACVQNAVENERIALRSFANVYGVTVTCPTLFLEPGVVQANSTPVTGILDIGRLPSGADETAEAIALAFRASTFESEVRTDIARWKYGKLLLNLGNAIEAVCGPPARRGPVGELIQAEGEAVLRAAGIAFVEEHDPRRSLLTMKPIDGERRPGGSSWQSLRRGTGSIESDYLNGEIVLLGRLTGVPTPANALLQRMANEMARDQAPPGSVPPEDVLALIDRKSTH